jgi:hypothetical protein
MIDPDMRFNPRSHIFLLPACGTKADFAAAQYSSAVRELRIESILSKIFGLPVRRRRNYRSPH